MYTSDDFCFDLYSDMDTVYPVVIQLVALENSSHGEAGCPRQSHATVATVEVTSDGNGWVNSVSILTRRLKYIHIIDASHN